MTEDKSAVILLRELVLALDRAYISSWQSTAAWDYELNMAREWLEKHEQSKSTSERSS